MFTLPMAWLTGFTEMKTGYECTNYFRGIDGLGNCDDECQWWHGGLCPCVKGSEHWDGIEHDMKEKKGKNGIRRKKCKK